MATGRPGAPTAPKPRAPKPRPAHSLPKPTGGGGGGTGGSGSGGGSAGGGTRSESKSRQLSSDRNKKQAENLESQAIALRLALRKTLKKGLRTRLGNVTRATKTQDKILREGYKVRLASLEGSALDNEASEGTQSASNTANMLRERGNALGEAMMMGAGESDVLKAQGASLRNWQANQTEVSRSYFDTVRSINASLGDLNTDTKQARVNVAMKGQSDRESLWNDYYNRRSETQTNLGNIYGQQADLYGNAYEQDESKDTAGNQDSAAAKSAKAFKNASKTAGKAFKNKGVPKKLMQWDGAEDFRSSDSMSRIQPQATLQAQTKPEGATLRKWRE